MIRILASLLVLLTLLATATTARDARAEGAGVWHAMAVTEGPTGPSITYFWSHDRSLRASTVVQGRPIVTMVHHDWYYVVDELAGAGVAIQRSPRALEEDALGGRPFGQEVDLMLDQGAELVGREQRDGQTVLKYRLSDDKARREVWAAPGDARIPLRVEIFDRAAGAARAVQYTGWRRDLTIPDRFFRPDARIALDRMTYQEYLRRTADAPLALPVLYGTLLHGLERGGS